MNSWELAILRIIAERGGKATTRQIYEDLEEGKFMALDESQLRSTPYGNRPAYQHEVRSFLSNLTQTGELVRIFRGTYGLTEKGHQRSRVLEL